MSGRLGQRRAAVNGWLSGYDWRKCTHHCAGARSMILPLSPPAVVAAPSSNRIRGLTWTKPGMRLLPLTGKVI